MIQQQAQLTRQPPQRQKGHQNKHQPRQATQWGIQGSDDKAGQGLEVESAVSFLSRPSRRGATKREE